MLFRSTAFLREDTPENYTEIDSSRIDRPGRVESRVNPYINIQQITDCEKERRNNAWLGVDKNGNPLQEKVLAVWHALCKKEPLQWSIAPLS